MDKYVLKIETDNLDVYRQICKVLGVDVQENLMKLGNKESVQYLYLKRRKKISVRFRIWDKVKEEFTKDRIFTVR